MQFSAKKVATVDQSNSVNFRDRNGPSKPLICDSGWGSICQILISPTR
jgi:hypothetical protein